ncbi:NADP-dependent oxidoreductase [Actinocrinis sp.]|uniref:NADP-dependent oxidoreductase n=1 Tax=Actinocrinis sp. TaxID=1920516 RepID=UPI002BA6053C|nr:NADP-dependent oxidoreductase [Actinocrinis sp.]HXR70965.1 NADP-dependent oxidoreductase [Actinocrinis sp.]
MTAESIPATTREVQLASRPDGDFRPENLAVVQVPLREPGEGEVVVRNEWMLMATAYRDLMNEDCKIPVPRFEIGAPLTGRTVGTVLRSNSPQFAPGDFVEHFLGWREHVVLPAQALAKRDRAQLPAPQYFLANGPTAWRGIVDMAGAGEGDVVFVSGATSGVGSLAGQIAKHRGAAKVIGSTGSKAKIDYLVGELGFDAAFDYHDGPVLDRLRELAPDGLNVVFDNVGGEQFEAAVQAAAAGARFALCGAMTEQLGRDRADLPRLDLMASIGKQLTYRPFACFHLPEQIAIWNEHFAKWLNQGTFKYSHTALEGGVEFAPKALKGLLDREYSGNVVLKLTV